MFFKKEYKALFELRMQGKVPQPMCPLGQRQSQHTSQGHRGDAGGVSLAGEPDLQVFLL